MDPEVLITYRQCSFYLGFCFGMDIETDGDSQAPREFEKAYYSYK